MHFRDFERVKRYTFNHKKSVLIKEFGSEEKLRKEFADVMDDNMATLLHHACIGLDIQTARFILEEIEAENIVNAKCTIFCQEDHDDGYSGYTNQITPLMLLCYGRCYYELEKIRDLNPDYYQRDQFIPLARLLLEHGADISILNSHGFNIFHLIVRSEEPSGIFELYSLFKERGESCVDFLLYEQNDPADCYGRTALEQYIQDGYEDDILSSWNAIIECKPAIDLNKIHDQVIKKYLPSSRIIQSLVDDGQFDVTEKTLHLASRLSLEDRRNSEKRIALEILTTHYRTKLREKLTVSGLLVEECIDLITDFIFGDKIGVGRKRKRNACTAANR